LSRAGVRLHLFVVLSCAALIPMMLFAWNRIEHLATTEMENVERESEATAAVAAQQLQVAMHGYIQASETVAAQLSTLGFDDMELAAQSINHHVRFQPEFLGAYYANASGVTQVRIRGAGEIEWDSTDYSDRDYFKTVIRERRTVVSRAVLGKVTQVISVQIASPVTDRRDELLGVVCTSLDLSAVTVLIKRVVAGVSFGRIVVVDNYGTVVADSMSEKAYASTNLANVALFRPVTDSQLEARRGLDERQVPVRGAAYGLAMPLNGWRVIVTVPESRIHEQTQRMQFAALKFSALICVAAVLLSAWLATLVARPLRALAEVAYSVAKGETSRQFQIPRTAPKELQNLAKALHTMTRFLQGHAQELEGIVFERTQELRDKNLALTLALQLNSENEKKLREDVQHAKRFQERLLPQLPRMARVDLAVKLMPLEQVSGDIIDVCLIDQETIRLFLADATGHGVQASMRTIFLKTTYDRIKTKRIEPNQVLEELNELLIAAELESDLHCTASCIDIYCGSNSIEVAFASAGGPPVYIRREGAVTCEVYCDGPLLGVSKTCVPKAPRFELSPGDELLMVSDGLIEQMNPNQMRFERELLASSTKSVSDASQSIDILLSALEKFRQIEPLNDDITVICVRVA
jgi:serine phosphatase RsbU (regulator of sigma subunit)